MPPPASAIVVQIRGPGIIGPLVQIRGPGELDPNILESFADASDMGGPVPVALLLAQTWADVSTLTALWYTGVTPGWLVGKEITAEGLAAAVEEAGSQLRILIAQEVADIVALTASWAFH